MQGALDGDNSASARKALAKVQKMLQLVSVKRQALALRDYRETLDECLKPEASSTMKILGYRMASRVPTCTTNEIWQLLLDSSVTELASSQNAPVLLYSIPILEQIPLPLVIGFLISSEKEPMNKLRAVLQHEQSDIRCCAIASLSKVTLDAAVSIANDGLFAFPFESHESRILCQQDLWTIITDVWKIIFQSLALVDAPHQQTTDVAGAAFAAMRMLYAKTTAMAPFHMALHQQKHKSQTAAQSAANDLAAYVYKEAFPRIRFLALSAQRLPVKSQVDAAWWLSMLLSMMMDRSGAKSPGLSVPYLEIDVVKANPHDDDDDDEAHVMTERARMDQLASNILESWLLPLMGRKVPLAQSATLCRAVFVLLSHPLQAFTRMKAATILVQQLIAQCFYHKSVDVKLEMSQLAVRAFAWMSTGDAVAHFTRVVEAAHLMERETDRHDLLQFLMKGICHRVTTTRDFQLLESIIAMDVFRQPVGTSKLSPRTSGSHVYRALVQALLPQEPNPQTRKERQVAQIIVLKGFIQVPLHKTAASVFARPFHDQETHDVVCYVALLSDHFQNMIRSPELALKESLLFYQQDLQRAWKQITSCAVRLQLLWIGIQLHATFQAVPTGKLLELLNYEVTQSFSSEDDERELSAEAMAASSSSSVFDDGKLGGGSVHGVVLGGGMQSAHHRDEHGIATTLAVVECMKAIGGLDRQLVHPLQQLQSKICSHVATHVSASSLQTHMLSEPLTTAGASSINSLYAFEIFRPASIFHPARHLQTHQPGAAVSSQTDDSDWRAPVLVTGSGDPLALHVSYRHPMPGHEDVIMLTITCCNTSNLALSDFEIHIRPRGPVRCIDPSNDLKIRMHQGGSSMASSLPPFGVLKAEKRFLIQRFAQTTFFFQVVFNEADASAGGDDQAQTITAMKVAVSNPFTANFDALFRRPTSRFTTGAYFQQIWRSAEDSMVFDIESAGAGQGSRSLGQVLLQEVSQRVAVISELVIDLPIHTQISLLTKTRWDEYVAISLTLSSFASLGLSLPASSSSPSSSSSSTTSPLWSGICEIRSTKVAIFEFAKHQSDTLAIFCGSKARLATTGHKVSSDDSNRTASASLHTANRTASRTASRLVSRSVSLKVAPPAFAPQSSTDPFAGNSFPTPNFSTAFEQPVVATKWPADDTTGGFGGVSSSPFGVDQLRPTAPVTTSDFGGFDAFTSTSTSAPTGGNSDP